MALGQILFRVTGRGGCEEPLPSHQEKRYMNGLQSSKNMMFHVKSYSEQQNTGSRGEP